MTNGNQNPTTPPGIHVGNDKVNLDQDFLDYANDNGLFVPPPTQEDEDDFVRMFAKSWNLMTGSNIDPDEFLKDTK